MFKKLLFTLIALVLAVSLSAQNYYSINTLVDHQPEGGVINPTDSWYDGVALRFSKYTHKYRLGSFVEVEAYIPASDPLVDILQVYATTDDNERFRQVRKQLQDKIDELSRYTIAVSQENTELKQENEILLDMLSDMIGRLEKLEIANQKLSKDK